jgi:hypothetical protein
MSRITVDRLGIVLKSRELERRLLGAVTLEADPLDGATHHKIAEQVQ